jgi:hypothetical protein
VRDTIDFRLGSLLPPFPPVDGMNRSAILADGILDRLVQKQIASNA